MLPVSSCGWRASSDWKHLAQESGADLVGDEEAGVGEGSALAGYTKNAGSREVVEGVLPACVRPEAEASLETGEVDSFLAQAQRQHRGLAELRVKVEPLFAGYRGVAAGDPP